MSFTQDVKNELMTSIPKEAHCLRAEHLGVLSREMESRPTEALYEKNCCKRAFLRGVFLSAGNISDPNRTYNLEFTVNEPWLANEIQKLLFSFDITGKIVLRNGKLLVYVKDGESIADFLKIVQANRSLLTFEEVRVVKDVRNRVNRNVNCETANMHKTAVAASERLKAISVLRESGRFYELPAQLREIAEVREKYPEATLEELGMYLDPPVGKSGVNHRLRKLNELAFGKETK